MRIILLFLVILIVAGCVQNTSMYYWGNYSNTLYAYKKNPSQETLQTHINMLDKIINTSNRYGKRVPPGIYAELALMKKTLDPDANVSELLLLEKQTYPEAGKFMEFVGKTMMGGANNEEN